MKAIVLAAGYATRLYPLTINKAKPLLPVGKKLIIDYILENIKTVQEIDAVYVVTNNKFYKDFLEWQKSRDFGKKVVIVNDNTTSDTDKLGAIGDIQLVINKMRINDDLLIIGGDNLFEFNLNDFINFFKNNSLSITAYRYPYKDKLSRFGLVQTDRNNRVVLFQEKPKNPKSDLVAICLYAFPSDKLKLIHEYLSGKNNKDAPGYYLEWLIEKEDVRVFVFDSQWHDIGSPESYRRAQKEFKGVRIE